MARKRTHVPDRKVKAAGFRSKFEYILNDELTKNGVGFDYEGSANTIFYVEPAKVKRYVADFLLDNGVIIEAKGYFDIADRKKHLLIREQYPQLDIRILFMNSKTKINKRSQTTYGDWCDHHGIIYADLSVPMTWCRLTKSKKERDAIFKTLAEMSKDSAIKNYKENCNNGL